MALAPVKNACSESGYRGHITEGAPRWTLHDSRWISDNRAHMLDWQSRGNPGERRRVDRGREDGDGRAAGFGRGEATGDLGAALRDDAVFAGDRRRGAAGH